MRYLPRELERQIPAAASLQRLAAAWRGQPGLRGSTEMTLVHRPARAEPASHAVAPGVRAMPWLEFVEGLD
jgi:hypothetical protein